MAVSHGAAKTFLALHDWVIPWHFKLNVLPVNPERHSLPYMANCSCIFWVWSKIWHILFFPFAHMVPGLRFGAPLSYKLVISPLVRYISNKNHSETGLLGAAPTNRYHKSAINPIKPTFSDGFQTVSPCNFAIYLTGKPTSMNPHETLWISRFF